MTTAPQSCAAQAEPALRRNREVLTADLLHRACAADAGDTRERLRTAAVQLNLNLAHGIARRYTGRGVERDDLNQVAALALVLATDRFDPHQGNPFTPYAIITIHGELKRHLRDHAWAVRPPRKLHDTYVQVMRATEDLSQSLRRIPTTSDIAGVLGITTEDVRTTRRVAQSYTATSIDLLQDERDGAPISAPQATEERDGIDALLTRMVLRDDMRLLSERDRMILHLRFDKELTQQQIGVRLGISQMQVSRLLTAIITRLRTHLSFDEHGHGQPVLHSCPTLQTRNNHQPTHRQIAS